MLSQVTMPATTHVARGVRLRAWTLLAAALIGAAIVVVVILVTGSTSAPSGPELRRGVGEEVPVRSDDQITRDLVRKGYLPAEVLEPAG